MSSYVKVSKLKVRKAVAAKIKFHINWHKERLEADILNVMNLGWKIFRPKTREAAIQKLHEIDFFYRDTEGKEITRQLKPILSMCDMSEDDYVMLSKEDCDSLRKYFD